MRHWFWIGTQQEIQCCQYMCPFRGELFLMGSIRATHR